MDLRGKVAVITGGASGIGYALAKQCINHGMDVVIADNDVSSLCDSVESLSNDSTEVLGVVCDVSRSDSVKHLAKQTIDRFKRIDWLFNNAGITGSFGPIWELQSEDYDKVLDINLHGAIHGIQHFLPLMQHNECRIINIASVYGLCTGSNFTPYILSKQALVALSECLYYDLKQAKKTNIQVSVACPSFAQTNLFNNTQSIGDEKIHNILQQLVEHSKPADDVACSIFSGIKNNEFYLLPDKEVKAYCQSRLEDILHQNSPTPTSLEKILTKLRKRSLAEMT